MTENKAFWKSKTIWANILSLIGTVVLGSTGFVITPEMATVYFVIINIILRAVTKENIVWSE